MSTELPWTQIAPGRARRVDADHVADFFWSVSPEGESQLLLDFPRSADVPSLPRLRGLVVKIVASGEDRSRLILRLSDSSLRDVFWRLCQDIVEASRKSAGEESAAHVAVRRTWRWHHLLRGGSSGLLSEAEQKGLLGEIHVLRHLLEIVEAGTAIESWRGPLGSPKDFELGLRVIEAKARRGAATPHVSISSEDQLDGDGLEVVLLHVIDLSAAAEGEGFTLTDAAHRLLHEIKAADEGLLELVEDRLASAGFSWGDDYSAFRWVEGQHRLYHVHDAFPRIQACEVPTGVSRVSYDIDLNALDEFEIDWPRAARLLLSGTETAP
jgi:hypothetical protein